MNTADREVQYQICRQPTGLAAHLERVRTGCVYYAAKTYRPVSGLPRVIWEILRWLEFPAPWLIPVLVWLARPTPWADDMRRQSKRQLDGNAYAARALAKGARYAFVDNPSVVRDDRYILVENALERNIELAMRRRSELDLDVVAVTGSSGKTTTHTLVSAVLLQLGQPTVSHPEQNTVVSISGWLLELKSSHRAFIVELGGLSKGTIARLCNLCQPTHGILTNVGVAHLGTYGSVEGIRRGKWELVDYLQANKGIFYANMLDPWIREQDLPPEQTIRFGQSDSSSLPDVSGRILSADPCLRLVWEPPEAEPIEIQTQLVGAYNFDNVMAAIAVGLQFGLAPMQIAKAIESCPALNNRSQWIERAGNQFILDSGSVNPSSLNAALTNFAQLTASPKMLILADLLRLGGQTQQAHQDAIATARRTGVERAVFIGPNYWQARDATFGTYFRSVPAFRRWWRRQRLTGHTILVKGAIRFNLAQIIGLDAHQASRVEKRQHANH